MIEGFGERLYDTIYHKGKSNCVRTAKAIGIERKALYRYISGENTPSTEILKAICDYFNVSADYLIYGEEK